MLYEFEGSYNTAKANKNVEHKVVGAVDHNNKIV